MTDLIKINPLIQMIKYWKVFPRKLILVVNTTKHIRITHETQSRYLKQIAREVTL